jgi:hypothetical protein
MKTKSCKAKARRLQDFVSATLNKELGWNTRPAIMGETGSDIKQVFTDPPLDIECKNTEKWTTFQDWAQLEKRTGEYHKALVYSKNRLPEPLVFVNFTFFIELLRKYYA